MDTFGKGNGHAPRTVPRPSYPPPTRLASSPRPRTSPPATIPSPPPLPASARRTDDYGIQRAVELLRRLPPGEREKFVEVVKMTLESVNVRVESIIDDAKRRSSEIEERIAVLQQEVTDREQEIAARREEIMNLEIEHSEITGVTQQLSSETAPESAPVLIEENAAANDEHPTSEIDLQATLAAIEFK
jgi:hypothetical protein